MFKAYGLRTAKTYVIANRISDALDLWPRGYMAAQRLRQRGRASAHRLVTAKHALVLEAFPRSSSSFAHRAFSSVNPNCSESVATHLHRSSQVITGARLGVPTLVLIRQPEEAVTSLLALSLQTGQLEKMDERGTQACINETLLRYSRFHERILPQRNILVAHFDDVTSDMGGVIGRLNETFGTTFKPFVHNETTIAALFQKRRKHLAPHPERDAIKTQLTQAYHAPSVTAARSRAEQAYKKIMEHHSTKVPDPKAKT